MFLNQSVAVGSLSFALRESSTARVFNWESPNIVRIASVAGHAVLPAEWGSDEDVVYDSI